MTKKANKNIADCASNYLKGNIKVKFKLLREGNIRVKFKLLKKGNVRFNLKLPEEEHLGQVQICQQF